eukprot:2236932-Pleurochrysis_carterae.AAC.1
MPPMRSSHARTFTKSDKYGWMCQVHPLSTTKLMQRSPFCRCLLRRSGLRRALLAINTRALVAIAVGMSEDVGATAGTGEGGTSVTAAPKRGGRTSRRHSRSAITLGAENAAS